MVSEAEKHRRHLIYLPVLPVLYSIKTGQLYESVLLLETKKDGEGNYQKRRNNKHKHSKLFLKFGIAQPEPGGNGQKHPAESDNLEVTENKGFNVGTYSSLSLCLSGIISVHGEISAESIKRKPEAYQGDNAVNESVHDRLSFSEVNK